VTATLVGAGAGPVRPGRPRPELVPLAPDDPEARADADAEYWAHLLTGTLELNPFQLATVLRYHGDRLGEPARLLSALSRAHAAVNRGGPAQLAWGVPPLPLPPADDRDRFLLALDALGAVPAAFDSFAEWAVGCMTPWVRGHADLVPETLALDLARHGGYLSMDGEYLRYYGEDPADLSAGAVIPLAAGLSDPYLRARAFARLLAVPDGAVRARALEEATAAVALVADPARAADACERLLPHLAGEVRSDLLRRAVAAAGTAEPEVRARLLARLVAHVPPAEAAALCTRALTAAAEVLDERRRAALLAALRPVLPRETARLDELAAGLADGWERGRAEGRSSRWLGRQRAGWDPGPAGWAAVYLAAVAAEVGRLRPGPGHDGLWAALGGPEQAAALAALREAADPDRRRGVCPGAGPGPRRRRTVAAAVAGAGPRRAGGPGRGRRLAEPRRAARAGGGPVAGRGRPARRRRPAAADRAAG
jgi:hypothetical protein